MDRYHPERATRLSRVQGRYAESFGRVMPALSSADGLRDAIMTIVRSETFQAVLLEARQKGRGVTEDILIGLRHSIRVALTRMDVDDLSLSKLDDAGLFDVFYIARFALAAVNAEALIRHNEKSSASLTGGVPGYASHVWQRSGRKIYSADPGLRWRLENTELRGVRTCDFRLPYRCIYVDLLVPRRCALSRQVKGYDYLPDGTPIEGVYVIEDYHKGDRMLYMVVIGDGASGGALCEGRVFGSAGKPIGAPWILSSRLLKEAMIKDGLEEAMVDGGGGKGAMQQVFNYVLNVVMYATTPGADSSVVPCDPEHEALFERAMKAPKGSRKRRGLLDRAKGRSDQKMTLLGGNLYVDKGRERSEPGDGTGGKVTVRTLAAGHWKRVVHGVGRKERRMSWIEPYWRGPELGPVSNKKHVLTDRSSRGQG